MGQGQVNNISARSMYLDLMKQTLSGMVYEDPSISTAWRPVSVFDMTRRQFGKDWPQHAQTMIGIERLDNLQECIESVLARNIPGDFIETGVWRGGACIFMRAVLKVYGVTDRTVWMADSFCGFPPNQEGDDAALASQPDQRYLSVPLKDVVSNFQLYDLLDHQVKVIAGYFADTLPAWAASNPAKRLAILRLDGDLYSSTMEALTALYPRLMPGGYCIVDDWNIQMCQDAVCHYRATHNIRDHMIDIDGHSVYWRKS